MYKNSFSINVIFLVFTIVGLALIPMLPIRLNPRHQGKSVTVSFRWGDVSAEVLEKEVTSPLEGVLSSVRGVKDVTSESSNGTGNIVLTFKDKADVDAARFEVASLVRSAYKKLPDGITRPVVSYNNGDDNNNPVLMVYNVNGDGSNYQLQKYAEEHIATYIGQLGDVSNVIVSGASPVKWVVNYNKFQMRSAGLEAGDIQLAIQNYLQSQELGNIRWEDKGNMFLTFKGQPSDSLIWNEIIVGNQGKRIIRLTDVADIQPKEVTPQSYYRINGLNTIYLVVYSEKGANQVQLSKKVKAVVAGLEEGFPDRFKMMLNYDASEVIQKEISKISARALMAILILLLFVLAISRRWRYLLIILLSLIVNLTAGVLFYFLLDVEIHLYSLAGVTVSLGIMIDNTIVMVDHIRHTGNKKSFLAILAATLTTIGSMVVIFFLKEEQRANLVDFAWVMIINLSVSLCVALWFIPAIMDKFPLGGRRAVFRKQLTVISEQCSVNSEQISVSSYQCSVNSEQFGTRRAVSKVQRELIRNSITSTQNPEQKKTGKWFKHKARSFRWSGRYTKMISFSKRWQWVGLVVIIWGFGLPTFLIPEEIKIDEQKGEKLTWWGELYNNTLGNSYYKSEVRPWVDKILGGSLYYFTSYMDQGSMDWDDQQTRLWVNVSMPDGATLEQMNKVFLEFENLLSKFKEVKRFVSSINSIDHSTIEIAFTKEGENSTFPYYLKQELQNKAIETGGADFSVYGVGRGFSNALSDGGKSSCIELKGYNYDQLVYFAQNLKDSLLLSPRINEVIIQSGSSWRGKPKYEFVMGLNPAVLVANNSSLQSVFNNLSFYSPTDLYAGMYYAINGTYPIIVKGENDETAQIWQFKNSLLSANQDYLRLKNVGEIVKERTGSLIRKTNQQYSLNVEYDFIGPYQLSKKVLNQNIEKLEKELPLGYYAQDGFKNMYNWNYKEKTQYWLLLLVVGIIYFICAILLESLVQPLVVIATIPISFIGVFLTFAIFKLKFDQGGYASMILLCGITVNSALYIINDFNNNVRNYNQKSRLASYIKAFNHKVIPILLTILSTILGMIPFLLDGQNGGFWFSLACGSIGGLLFSLVAIFVWLPLFMKFSVNSKQLTVIS